MAHSDRQRLARVVRRSDADLAEAALCVCADLTGDVDVDVQLLRLDAIADALRVRGPVTGDAERDAALLVDELAGQRGFTGNHDDYYDPDNALLTRVLDRRQGLPITLSVLYVSIARRVGMPAWGIALPGHYYVGIGTRDRPVVLDPFANGRIVDRDELAERIRTATAGRVEFTRAHLRAANAATTVRRILNNLTRDYTNRGQLSEALRAVEVKQVLPNSPPDDHRVRGELLAHLGRYREAAEAYETYLTIAPDATDAAEIRTQAVRARAKLN